jgi:4-hydroxybenzoyl-CoA thioesterase
MSVIHERAVRFEEVDAAGIAFFGRFFNWCHEAMERFFDAIPGGYVGLITRRRIGFPAVHVIADWKSPLRYGDVARIETSVVRVGETSATFRYVLTRVAGGVTGAGGGADTPVATIEHVTVATDLDSMSKVPLPDDCRVLLERHHS